MSANYVIGIDLGTTNSVLAYAPLAAEQPRGRGAADSAARRAGRRRKPHDAAVVPVSGRRARGRRRRVRSAVGARAARFAVGELARRQAAENPERTVGGGEVVARPQPGRSPSADPAVERAGRGAEGFAGRRRRGAIWSIWSRPGSTRFPMRRSPSSMVVLTVPASFDAAARELTREAALAAGLAGELDPARRAAGGRLCLAGRRRASAGGELLKVGDTLLVCDVGGGTTDLTLVGVDRGGRRAGAAADRGRQSPAGRRRQHGPGPGPLRRPASSPRRASSSIRGSRCRSGIRAARRRKRCSREGGPKKHPVSVLGRGSKLIGGTVTVEVEREAGCRAAARRLLSRSATSTDRPARRRAVGLSGDRPAV